MKEVLKMISTFQQKLYVYMLCVAVLFTTGTGFDARDNHTSYILSNSSAEIELHEQIADSSKLSIIQMPTESIPFVPAMSGLLDLQDTIQSTELQQNNEVTEIAVANYEVTAYFLNVRVSAAADGTSGILDVVKKGSILEVIEVLDSGWLKLIDGGYVHGRYAKMISEPIKESARVKILSVEHITEEQYLPELQPAKNIKHDGVPNKPTSVVKTESNLTEEHIAQIFEGTALSGYELEKAILEIEREYGINAYFTIAVMKLESGHGESRIARNKNNMFGLNAIDSDTYNKAFSFETKGESVQKFGQLISENYIDEGLTSLEKVARKYCQANPKWPILVKSIMESDYNKLL
jgi:flagellum-specific peptidoglycan hydrolase FlgJ